MHKLKIDLIILDYKMPEMGGIGVLEKVKKDSGISSIPVIMLTGALEDEAYEEVAGRFNLLCLHKPIELDALKLKIEEVLKISGRA